MLDHAAAIEACARGDQAALRAIHEAEAARLIGVAQRILRRRDLAEEAVQDGFVQIWRKAGQFDRRLGSGRGWIYAVVRNRALSLLRNGAREDITAPEDLDALRDDAVEQPYEGLGSGDRLRFCLAQLEPERRRAILMAYALGLTQGEIAGRMGAPLGTVKAWMRRALIALRECMA